MAALRTQTEDAILAALAPLKLPALGGGADGYLACLEPYGGELEGLDDLEEVERALAGRTPGVLVFTSDGEYRGLSGQRRRYRKDLLITIIVASSLMRSWKDRNRGEVAGTPANLRDPGTYQIMEDIFSKLVGVDLGVVGLSLLKPENEKIFAQTPSVCVWRVNYSAETDAFAVPKEAGALALTEIEGRTNLEDAPFATGTGDSIAVAAGVATLTDAGAAFLADYVGQQIRISGATSAANNGLFTITAVPTGTTIRWSNAAAVAEPFTGTWKIIPAPVVINRTPVTP